MAVAPKVPPVRKPAVEEVAKEEGPRVLKVIVKGTDKVIEVSRKYYENNSADLKIA